jgi:geranylgeranyl diphosphate synthase type II
MDNANLRRGKDTINKKWSNNQAILSGDLLLIQSYQYLLASKYISVEMHEEFSKTAVQICEGQQLDLDFQLKHEIKPAEYFKMIELKTAALIKFSVSVPLYISTVNNPNLKNNTRPVFLTSCFHTEKNKNIMNSVGLLLGKLFQVQDDYLDLYGKESQLGKRIGGDILEKKKTFLYIEAYRQSTLKQRKDLINIYHSGNENKINLIQSLYDELNIKDYTLQTIQSLYEQLVDLISDIEVPIHKKESFIEFIELILKRNF